MIALDTQKFMEDGYLILRGLVPPDMLGPLQDTSEELVRRKWPESMPQGAFANWIHGFGNNLIDEQTANMVEFFMHENTLGVAHREPAKLLNSLRSMIEGPAKSQASGRIVGSNDFDDVAISRREYTIL